MRTTKQIIEQAESFQPGSMVSVKGLVSSSGSVSDVRVKLLPPNGYRELQQQSLDQLLKRKELCAVGQQMAISLGAALTPVDADAQATSRGPAYERIGQSALHTLASDPAAVYLLRAEIVGDLPPPAPPKSEAAAAKYALQRGLSIGRYLHVIKLKDGMFDEVVLA